MIGMRKFPLLLITVAVVAVVYSCSEERKSYVPNANDPEHIPTMTTTDVNSVISDSGYTRYKIITPLWQMFDEAKEPKWKFPDGLEVQQFDEQMNEAANIKCDSATYFSEKRLWRLDGHVIMINTLRDSFATTQLYWDQRAQKVYSDSFIHIVRTDRIIEGYGFESNQNMTYYTVSNPTGIIPVERTGAQQADTTTADTASVPLEQASQSRRPAPVRASERNATAEDNQIISPVQQTRRMTNQSK